MPNVRLLADCIVAGAAHSAGDIVAVSDQDATTLFGVARAVEVADDPAPPAPPKPHGRTKAQIAADLAAAKEAEAQLQADLAQAQE